MQIFGSAQSKSVNLIIYNDKNYYYMDFKGNTFQKHCHRYSRQKQLHLRCRSLVQFKVRVKI